MPPILFISLSLLALLIALLLGWLASERRGQSVTKRISLGIAVMVCLLIFACTLWQQAIDQKLLYEHLNFGETLAFLELDLQQGKSREVQGLLSEFQPGSPSKLNYAAIGELRRKLTELAPNPTATTPAPSSR